MQNKLVHFGSVALGNRRNVKFLNRFVPHLCSSSLMKFWTDGSFRHCSTRRSFLLLSEWKSRKHIFESPQTVFIVYFSNFKSFTVGKFFILSPKSSCFMRNYYVPEYPSILFQVSYWIWEILFPPQVFLSIPRWLTFLVVASCIS